MNKLAKKLAVFGVMTAMSTILNIFSINIIYPYFVLSFTTTVSFLAGVILGPIGGLVVGFGGDFLGYVISNSLGGVYNVFIGLASGLSGAIPGLIFWLYKRYAQKRTLLKTTVLLVISFILTTAICTSFINTFALWVMYAKGKKSFFTYLTARVPYQFIVCGINAVLSWLILTAIEKIPSINKYLY